MIKLIIFDLDGVIADTEHIHYHSLCESINLITAIPVAEVKQIIKTDGSTTKSKLKILKQKYNLPDTMLADIDNTKQINVLEEFKKISPDTDKIEMLSVLSKNYILAIGSNTRRASADIIIDSIGIRHFFKLILSIDDVHIEKPDPTIYNKIMNVLNIAPEHTLIIEDSPKGIAAARASLAHVLVAESVVETTLGFIENELDKINSNYSSSDGGPRNTIF